MIEVLTGFGVVVVVIAVGYVLGRTDALGPGARRALANMVYLVATPALLFDILLDTDPREIFSANFLVIALSALVAGFLGFLLLRLRGSNSPDSLIGMLASSYANAGNLGVPLAVYILDDAAAVIPVILFQVAFYAPVTLTTLDMLHASKQSNLLRNVLLAFRNPMLLAAIAGLLIGFLRVPVPVFVGQPVALLAGASVPLALMVFGMSLVGSTVSLTGDVALVVLLKNVVHPIIAGLLAFHVFGLSGHALFTLVVLGALPTAQNVLTYALRFRTNERLARDTGVVSTLVSFPVLVAVTVLLGPG
ncbi:AEC family transporter [Corynebacterium comes]|uniref:Transporter YfdV n=1 Tax=Corynebacterium comes TaxID=2675218 RepID=A0A6B8VYG3_9CORY|nr:AEC family transporter [Corynebacterium comes]QGU05221.1 putative transporter YfdV [Corynebacterium comes]